MDSLLWAFYYFPLGTAPAHLIGLAAGMAESRELRCTTEEKCKYQTCRFIHLSQHNIVRQCLEELENTKFRLHETKNRNQYADDTSRNDIQHEIRSSITEELTAQHQKQQDELRTVLNTQLTALQEKCEKISSDLAHVAMEKTETDRALKTAREEITLKDNEVTRLQETVKSLSDRQVLKSDENKRLEEQAQASSDLAQQLSREHSVEVAGLKKQLSTHEKTVELLRTELEGRIQADSHTKEQHKAEASAANDRASQAERRCADLEKRFELEDSFTQLPGMPGFILFSIYFIFSPVNVLQDKVTFYYSQEGSLYISLLQTLR